MESTNYSGFIDKKLLGSVWTAMDQTYTGPKPGILFPNYLQPVDNSASAENPPRNQPFSYEKYEIVSSISIPSTGNITIYRSNPVGTLLIVPTGTNGNSDVTGWLTNLTDEGYGAWESVKNKVYEYIENALRDSTGQNLNIVFAGDSRGGAIAQFAIDSILRNKENLAVNYPYLSNINNQNLALITHDSPGIEDVLIANGKKLLSKELWQGVSINHTATKLLFDQNSFLTPFLGPTFNELVTCLGGQFADQGGITYYNVEYNPKDILSGLKNLVPYAHRLSDSGWDYAQANGGDAAIANLLVAPVTSKPRITKSAAMDISFYIAGMGDIAGRGLTKSQATARMLAALSCGVAGTSVIELLRSGVELDLLGMVATGLLFMSSDTLLASVCLVASAASLIQSRTEVTPGNTGGVWSTDNIEITTRAPAKPSGFERIAKRTSDGSACVFDTNQSTGAMTVYFYSQNVHYSMGVDSLNPTEFFGTVEDIQFKIANSFCSVRMPNGKIIKFDDKSIPDFNAISAQIIKFSLINTHGVEVGTVLFDAKIPEVCSIQGIDPESIILQKSGYDLQIFTLDSLNPITLVNFLNADSLLKYNTNLLQINFEYNGKSTPVLFGQESAMLNTGTGGHDDKFIVFGKSMAYVLGKNESFQDWGGGSEIKVGGSFNKIDTSGYDKIYNYGLQSVINVSNRDTVIGIEGSASLFFKGILLKGGVWSFEKQMYVSEDGKVFYKPVPNNLITVSFLDYPGESFDIAAGESSTTAISCKKLGLQLERPGIEEEVLKQKIKDVIKLMDPLVIDDKVNAFLNNYDTQFIFTNLCGIFGINPPFDEEISSYQSCFNLIDNAVVSAKATGSFKFVEVPIMSKSQLDQSVLGHFDYLWAIENMSSFVFERLDFSGPSMYQNTIKISDLVGGGDSLSDRVAMYLSYFKKYTTYDLVHYSDIPNNYEISQPGFGEGAQISNIIFSNEQKSFSDEAATYSKLFTNSHSQIMFSNSSGITDYYAVGGDIIVDNGKGQLHVKDSYDIKSFKSNPDGLSLDVLFQNGEKITIINWFAKGPEFKILSRGVATVNKLWTYDEITNMALNQISTDLTSTDQSILIGHTGFTDNIYAGVGNDTIITGKFYKAGVGAQVYLSSGTYNITGGGGNDSFYWTSIESTAFFDISHEDSVVILNDSFDTADIVSRARFNGVDLCFNVYDNVNFTFSSFTFHNTLNDSNFLSHTTKFILKNKEIGILTYYSDGSMLMKSENQDYKLSDLMRPSGEEYAKTEYKDGSIAEEFYGVDGSYVNTFSHLNGVYGKQSYDSKGNSEYIVHQANGDTQTYLNFSDGSRYESLVRSDESFYKTYTNSLGEQITDIKNSEYDTEHTEWYIDGRYTYEHITRTTTEKYLRDIFGNTTDVITETTFDDVIKTETIINIDGSTESKISHKDGSYNDVITWIVEGYRAYKKTEVSALGDIHFSLFNPNEYIQYQDSYTHPDGTYQKYFQYNTGETIRQFLDSNNLYTLTHTYEGGDVRQEFYQEDANHYWIYEKTYSNGTIFKDSGKK